MRRVLCDQSLPQHWFEWDQEWRKSEQDCRVNEVECRRELIVHPQQQSVKEEVPLQHLTKVSQL